MSYVLFLCYFCGVVTLIALQLLRLQYGSNFDVCNYYHFI